MSMNVWIKLRKDDDERRPTKNKHRKIVKNYKRKKRNKLGNNW